MPFEDIVALLDKAVENEKFALAERVLTWLGQLHESDRLVFVKDVCAKAPHYGLYFAHRCLKTCPSFEALLKLAVEQADASSIKYWLEAIAPRVGIRHVATVLIEMIPSHPVGVEKAAYWLPGLEVNGPVKSESDRLVRALHLSRPH